MVLTRRNKTDYFLGLDLSLTGTGVVVLNSKSEVIIAKTLKNKFFGMERLRFLREEILEVIKLCPPKVICIEGYAMGRQAGQAFAIGELGGVIKLALFELDLYSYLVPPTRLKKFIVGGGKAEKDMIMMKVLQYWGWESEDNNQADAYGLAKIGQAIDDPEIAMNRAQKEVINDILYPPKKKGK